MEVWTKLIIDLLIVKGIRRKMNGKKRINSIYYWQRFNLDGWKNMDYGFFLVLKFAQHCSVICSVRVFDLNFDFFCGATKGLYNIMCYIKMNYFKDNHLFNSPIEKKLEVESAWVPAPQGKLPLNLVLTQGSPEGVNESTSCRIREAKDCRTIMNVGQNLRALNSIPNWTSKLRPPRKTKLITQLLPLVEDLPR